MKTWIPWAIWMDKWCQNELKWRLKYHEQDGWTNDAKLNSNEDLNPMSNMDVQMMPKWTQMKTWIPWAIWMDKWCQNELKWRVESPEQYGWTNDAKMDSNEDLNTDEQYGWTNDAKINTNEDSNIMSNIGWYKWCQNELKWRLESHEEYWWTNDAKMNSNVESNPMSNMDGRMMPKCTQMKTWIPWAILMDKWCQNELKWTQMKTWILMSNMDGQMIPKWTQMKSWISWAIWMDKWCQNELKWILESHEQYGWTNDAKMNSNEDSNIMSNMDGQMMPKWTQMKTWIPWAIWMVKWCQNEFKWKVQYHGHYGWTNDAKWTQLKTWIPWAIWMDKWCQNELKWTKMKTWIPWAIWMDKWCQNKLKWRLESHEQYGWTNDAKMNSNEDSNIMSNMDGQMMPKWTQMKTWIPWAIWMFKWCQNELKWRLEPHEQYGWTNDAKMNSNEDLNPMSNMDGQMMPK